MLLTSDHDQYETLLVDRPRPVWPPNGPLNRKASHFLSSNFYCLPESIDVVTFKKIRIGDRR